MLLELFKGIPVLSVKDLFKGFLSLFKSFFKDPYPFFHVFSIGNKSSLPLLFLLGRLSTGLNLGGLVVWLSLKMLIPPSLRFSLACC